MTADALQERIAEALVDAAHDQYPKGMRPGDNEDCGCPWGIGEIDWLGFANAVLAVLADTDPTDLGLEQIGGVAYCVMHDEMDIEGYDSMGECRRSDGCVEVPVYADHRTEETPDA